MECGVFLFDYDIHLSTLDLFAKKYSKVLQANDEPAQLEHGQCRLSKSSSDVKGLDRVGVLSYFCRGHSVSRIPARVRTLGLSDQFKYLSPLATKDFSSFDPLIFSISEAGAPASSR